MNIRRTFNLLVLTVMLVTCFVDVRAQNITGSGTNGFIPKFTGTTTVGNSIIRQTGTTVAIGSAPLSGYKFYVLDSTTAIKAESTSAAGLETTGSSYGVYATATNTGVYGFSSGGSGVSGSSTTGIGLIGSSTSSRAGWFLGTVVISSNGSNPGDLSVAGMLSKGGGSFKIDHPLDPENKYLYHSFVESPDMMNIYNGNTTTDDSGAAVVTLPDYFEALNGDFRYQLTVIGQFAQAIVAEKIKGNRFVIKTSQPNVEVSWQVTGVRQDAFAKKNRIQVEVEKNESERGFYLHPDAFNQPAERSIEWARRQVTMAQVKSAGESPVRQEPK